MMTVVIFPCYTDVSDGDGDDDDNGGGGDTTFNQH